MPTPASVHVDQVLTNISVQYRVDNDNYIADKVFPEVPVKKQSDVYYKYNLGDYVQGAAQERADKTESAGGDYTLSEDTYYAKVYSFHKDVGVQEKSNMDNPLDANTDATEFVTTNFMVSREKKFIADFLNPTVWQNNFQGDAAADWANGKVLYWSDPASNPIMDVKRASIYMASKTGKRPNVLIVSPYTYLALSENYELIDRIKYVQQGFVDTQLMASAFGVEQIYVPYGINNVARSGQTQDIRFVTETNFAFLAYRDNGARLRSVTAGLTFAWTGLEGSAGPKGRIIRLPMNHLGLGTERIEIEGAYCHKIIANDLGVYFDGIIAPGWTPN